MLVLKDVNTLHIALGLGILLAVILGLYTYRCIFLRHRHMVLGSSDDDDVENLIVETTDWTSKRVFVVKNGSFLYLDLRRPTGKVLKGV